MTMVGGFAPNNVCPTDHATVLVAIMAKLQNDLEDLFGHESVLYISDQEITVELADHLFCTVAPSDGAFPSDGVDGSGQYLVYENANFSVTVRSRIQTDQIERSTQAYLDQNRGLLPIKKRVLKALAGQQLYSAPNYGDQATYDTSTGALLTAVLCPTRSQHQSQQEEDKFSEFTVGFSCQWNWDLE